MQKAIFVTKWVEVFINIIAKPHVKQFTVYGGSFAAFPCTFLEQTENPLIQQADHHQ